MTTNKTIHLYLIQGGLPEYESSTDDQDLWEIFEDVCKDKAPLADLMRALYPSARERIRAFTDRNEN